MRSALRKTRRRRGSVTLPPCLWQHSLGCTGGPETGPCSPRPHSPLSTPQRQNLRGGLQACSPPAPQTLPWQRCPRGLMGRSWGARGAAGGSPRHRGGSLGRGEASWGSPLPRQLLRPPCHGTAPLGGGVGPEEPPGPAGGAVAVTAVWGVRGPGLGSPLWGRGSLLALLPAVLLRGGRCGVKAPRRDQNSGAEQLRTPGRARARLWCPVCDAIPGGMCRWGTKTRSDCCGLHLNGRIFEILLWWILKTVPKS